MATPIDGNIQKLAEFPRGRHHSGAGIWAIIVYMVGGKMGVEILREIWAATNDYIVEMHTKVRMLKSDNSDIKKKI